MVALIMIAVHLLADAVRFSILLFGPTRSVQAENLFLRRQLALFKELGIQVSPRTVGKYMPKRVDGQPRGDQLWSTFLKNHAKAILACDFFVAVTVTCRRLYVFVVIEHGSRRLARVAVTTHPCAGWTLQQLREVIGFDDAHRYLIHDRDSIFARRLNESIEALGVNLLKSPLHSQ